MTRILSGLSVALIAIGVFSLAAFGEPVAPAAASQGACLDAPVEVRRPVAPVCDEDDTLVSRRSP